MNLKVKQKIPLKIKRMGINGEGIGFYQKTLVFVPGALKGEDIYCQITSIKRNFVEAKLLKVNKKSKFRVVPACTIYNECGGCQIMHLHYDKQLEFKTDLLHQALKNLLLQDIKTMKFVQLSECQNQNITEQNCNFKHENSTIRSRQACMHKTLITS